MIFGRHRLFDHSQFEWLPVVSIARSLRRAFQAPLASARSSTLSPTALRTASSRAASSAVPTLTLIWCDAQAAPCVWRARRHLSAIGRDHAAVDDLETGGRKIIRQRAMISAQAPVEQGQFDGAKSCVPRDDAVVSTLLRVSSSAQATGSCSMSLPAWRESLTKKFWRQEVADTRDHGFRGFAGDVGARQTFAETAAAVAAGDFDDHCVAFFAVVQRMAKNLVKRDAQSVDG